MHATTYERKQVKRVCVKWYITYGGHMKRQDTISIVTETS